MTALPLVTQHLKHINQALSSSRGLSLFSYTLASGVDLHPAFASGIGQGSASHDFFNEQMDLIFQAVFPNGLDDLRELLPEFFTDEQLKNIEKSAKSIAVEKLPLVLVELFNREDLVDLFNVLLEDVVNTLEGPIAIKKQTPIPPLSHDEKKRQDEMDQMAGELFLEAARLLELPLGFFKKSIAASIGASMREKFNGEFLSEALQKVFSKRASNKFIKLDENKRAQVGPLAEKKLKELEWKLAEKSIGFAFRYLAASIDGATDVFTNPVLKFLRKSIFAVCSFVFFKVVGTLLRLFQVKRLTAIFLHSLIHYRAEKILKVFVHGDMHQNVLYQGIDALKGVFNAGVWTNFTR